MNKKIILALTSLAVVLIGCNSGSETLTGVYLSQGTYSTTITKGDGISQYCADTVDAIFGNTIYSNGYGLITSGDGTTEFNLNVANNPCLSNTNNLGNTLTLSECKYNVTSGELTADFNLTGTPSSCNGTILFQHQ